MAKQKITFLVFIAWLIGLLVSLAVGFGMADKVLIIRWIPEVITVIAGWIVVIGAILTLILGIIRLASE